MAEHDLSADVRSPILKSRFLSSPPSFFMRTGPSWDQLFKTKIDFLSGAHSKLSHGQPDWQPSWKKNILWDSTSTEMINLNIV